MNDSQLTMSDFQLTGIECPHDNDVLSGRGNFVNAHPGNQRFRTYVLKQKEAYDTTCKGDKPAFSKLIVSTIRNLIPPGRFLIQEKDTKLWSDIGDKKAWNKTRQALREKPFSTGNPFEPTIRPPVEESFLTNLMPNDIPSSMMRLQSLFNRQLEVAALPLPIPTEQVYVPHPPTPMEQAAAFHRSIGNTQSYNFLGHNQYDPGPFFPHRSAPHIIPPGSFNVTHKSDTIASSNNIMWSSETASPPCAPLLSENTVSNSNNDDESMPDPNSTHKYNTIATPNDVPWSTETASPTSVLLLAENAVFNNDDKLKSDQNSTDKNDTIASPRDIPRYVEVALPYNNLLFSESNVSNNDDESISDQNATPQYDSTTSPNDTPRSDESATPTNVLLFSDNAASNDDNVMSDDENILDSDVAQLPTEPSTRLSASWATDFHFSFEDLDLDLDQHNSNDVEHDNFHIIANDVKQANANDSISEGKKSIIHDHCGKAIPLRNSFTRGDGETTTKDKRVPPIISEDADGISEEALHLSTSVKKSLDPLHGSNYRTRRSSMILNPRYSEPRASFSSAENDNNYGRQDSTLLEQSLDSSNYRERRRSITRNPRYSGLRASFTSNENDNTVEGQDSISFEKIIDSRNSDIYREKKSLIRNSIRSETRASISTSGDYEDFCANNEDLLTFDADIEAIQRIRFSGINLISARLRKHSSILSQRSSAQSNLDDLSWYSGRMSGRMSICENTSLSDSGIFSMSQIELADWQKEAAEWEKEADMEDC